MTGYMTNAKSFSMMANIVLLRNRKMFRKVERGVNRPGFSGELVT
jgi:hypothetical protein